MDRTRQPRRASRSRSAKRGDHIFGLGLVNDWSARDIQYWEMPPLGPFLGKNFGTTVSPWIVTAEALEPFRVAQPPRPAGDPRPLPYLWDDADQRSGAFDIALEALILTAQMREKGQEPHRMSRSNTTDLYWTLAQLVAHHTCNGCNLLPGDIFGSGTISGPTAEGYGSLSELSQAGTRTITLAQRRDPHLPRKRRRGDLPRALPARRLRADRLRRMPRPHHRLSTSQWKARRVREKTRSGSTASMP